MSALEEYIDAYGYHFSKKLYEWAVSMMKDRNGNKVTPKTKEEVNEFLRMNGVTLKNNSGHDAAYVHAMLFADCYGSSLPDDKHLAMGIKDFLDDIDGTESKALDHFVSDCKAKDIRIYWDEMI